MAMIIVTLIHALSNTNFPFWSAAYLFKTSYCQYCPFLLSSLFTILEFTTSGLEAKKRSKEFGRMEVLTVLLKPILDRLVNPVLEEIGYMFQYRSNIENFRKKLERIKVMRDGVKERIEEEERNLQVVAPRVKAWLHETDKITAKEQRILAKKSDVEKGCFKGLCPNLKLRYSLSKKAKKGTEDVVELLVEGYQYSNFSRLGPFLSQRSSLVI